jgi:NADH dehydrogenase
LASCLTRITLIDRRNHHLFQPLLYQVATAALNPSDIAMPIRRILRRQKNIQHFLGSLKLDPLIFGVVAKISQLANRRLRHKVLSVVWCGCRKEGAAVILGEAEAVDVPRRRVVLRAGQLAYDFLIVAAGATYSYFGHDDWAEAAPGLKTIEDALEIRRRVLIAFEVAERESDASTRAEWLTIAVIGAGPTGVEMAGALAEIPLGSAFLASPSCTACFGR